MRANSKTAHMTIAWLLLAPAAWGHIGGGLAPAFELLDGGVPNLDGDLVDWEVGGELVQPTFRKEDFEPLNTSHDFGLSDQDIDFNWYFAWAADLQRLYFAAEVFDDVYLRPTVLEEGEISFHYDSIELMVDGDHSGGAYNGFEPDSSLGRLIGSQVQHYMIFPGLSEGARIATYPLESGVPAVVPYTAVGGGVTGPTDVEGRPGGRTRYVIEGFVTPWDALNANEIEQSKRTVLRSGGVIGVQISMSDCDTRPGECHGYYTLRGAPNTWRLAENFVDLELVASPGATQVEPASWARVKATFE